MKTSLWLFALLIPLAALADKPRSVAVTIQETGQAQVSETHNVEPLGSDGTVRIGPLPETLLPSSVNAVPIERGETLEILSQRFAYDLQNDEALFRAFQGTLLTCHQGSNVFSGRMATLPDFSGPAPTLLLDSDGLRTRAVPNLLTLDSIEFPERADLARTPTLIWQMGAGQSAPAAVQLNYAVSGLSWIAAHVAILADDARSISLSSRIRVSNRTGREFTNARLRLALTDKGQFAPLVPAPGDPRAAKPPALRFSADGRSWVPERTLASSAIVATYDLPTALTLPAGIDVCASLSAVSALPVETRHVYDGVRFDRYQRNRRSDWNLGTESAATVETRLVFKNEQSIALPPGEFRLMRGQADHALEWIGTDWLPALRPGESAALQLGPAAGLIGRRLRTSYAEVVPLKTSEESFEITLENQTPADATITVIEHLYRGENHEISAASAEHVPGDDPNSIRFEMPVKAGSQNSFTYTVRYNW
jgi:hypothetical protein